MDLRKIHGNDRYANDQSCASSGTRSHTAQNTRHGLAVSRAASATGPALEWTECWVSPAIGSASASIEICCKNRARYCVQQTALQVGGALDPTVSWPWHPHRDQRCKTIAVRGQKRFDLLFCGECGAGLISGVGLKVTLTSAARYPQGGGCPDRC